MRAHWLILAVAGLVLLAACGEDSDDSQLKPADSQAPAAGVCEEPPAGDVATITVNVDTPSPRCSKITAGQRLRVVNDTSEAVRIELGRFDVTIGPGKERFLDAQQRHILLPAKRTALLHLPAGRQQLDVSDRAGGARAEGVKADSHAVRRSASALGLGPRFFPHRQQGYEAGTRGYTLGSSLGLDMRGGRLEQS